MPVFGTPSTDDTLTARLPAAKSYVLPQPGLLAPASSPGLQPVIARSSGGPFDPVGIE